MRITYRLQALIVFVLAFVLFGNTLTHQYALDDGLVITHNSYTQQGIDGIGGLLTHDNYEPFYKSAGADQQLTGGRYRPLSLITFALEREFFGESPAISHFINVFLFGITLVLLLWFFRAYLLKGKPAAALAAVLLFACHPIHTEVVANIKSRDEILSLIGILITFWGVLTYQVRQDSWRLVVVLVGYTAALFSKEYGLTLLVLVPIALYLFSTARPLRIAGMTILLLIPAGLYLYARYQAVGFASIEQTTVLNDPFFFASGPEKWATKVFILLKYFILQVWPNPLTYDYTYAQVSYRKWLDPLVIASVALHVGLVWYGVRSLWQKRPESFLVFFYLGNLFLVSNLLVDIGGTLGERLIYHSSVAFVGAVGVLFSLQSNRWRWPILLTICVVFGYMTIDRNQYWENDKVLYVNDVKTSTKSSISNGNAGAIYINMGIESTNEKAKQEYLKKGETFTLRAIEIFPDYINDHFNLFLARYHLNDLDGAADALDYAARLDRDHPKLAEMLPMLARAYFLEGIEAGKQGDISLAVELFLISTRCDPTKADTWYNLGGAYYESKRYVDARGAWAKAIEIQPDHELARQGFRAVEQLLRKP
jgi:hypothetical protein